MSLPNKVHLLEVSPRDGLQNEKQFVPSDIKIAFINHLSETGLQAIEVTSFVSPKKIPQLADHEEVFQDIQKYKGIEYSALIPNTQRSRALTLLKCLLKRKYRKLKIVPH